VGQTARQASRLTSFRGGNRLKAPPGAPMLLAAAPKNQTFEKFIWSTTMARKKVSKSDIPDPTRMHALNVIDGTVWVGQIVEHDGVYFAFRTDDVFIGAFTTQREAIHALPAAKKTLS
jgi:hypothetical protein